MSQDYVFSNGISPCEASKYHYLDFFLTAIITIGTM